MHYYTFPNIFIMTMFLITFQLYSGYIRTLFSKSLNFFFNMAVILHRTTLEGQGKARVVQSVANCKLTARCHTQISAILDFTIIKIISLTSGLITFPSKCKSVAVNADQSLYIKTVLIIATTTTVLFYQFCSPVKLHILPLSTLEANVPYHLF